jgi:hypothetical protein
MVRGFLTIFCDGEPCRIDERTIQTNLKWQINENLGGNNLPPPVSANTLAQRDYRARKKADEKTEVRGIYASKGYHAEIKQLANHNF